MTLQQLKYIAAVAKYGSFSKAAQYLYVSQPGISKMVRAAEEELGITIFMRSGSGITLTSEGKELLTMGTRLLNDADRITQHFKQEIKETHETFSVSSQHYCFVIDTFAELQSCSDKPHYNYKLHLGPTLQVIQQVADRESELGVLFISEQNVRYMQHIFDDNNLEYHELKKSRPYVFIHKSHPLALKETLTFNDLEPYPFIMYELDENAPSILQEEFIPADFNPRKISVINDLYQSLQVMLNCSGYDLGSGIISPGNRALGIVKRPVEGFDTPISIGWICRESHLLSPLGGKFIDSLSKVCEE